MLLQKRDVFLVELLLQGFGGGGNDHAAAAADRGNQVGQRFARSRAGFDDGVVMLFEGIVNHFGHFQLTGAMLVAANHAAFQQTTGPENVAHGGGHRRRGGEANLAISPRPGAACGCALPCSPRNRRHLMLGTDAGDQSLGLAPVRLWRCVVANR